MATTLKVLYTPQYISVDEFARIFAQLDGYLTCRVVKGADGEPVGYVDFRDAVTAEKARGIYNDWQGWGPKGLQIEFANPGGDLAQGAGAKRGREDLQGGENGGYKQQRTDQPASMGYGSAPPIKAETGGAAYGGVAAGGQLANGSAYDPSNAGGIPAYAGQPAGATGGTPQYGTVQTPSGQPTAAAVADPRYGVPPRIPANQPVGTGYSQPTQDTQYMAPQGSSGQQTQYPSQQAPAAAQPAQYPSQQQVQYPGQQAPPQQTQYGTAAPQGQYGTAPVAVGQGVQQPMQQAPQQPQYGAAPAAAQPPAWTGTPQGSQYGVQPPVAQPQYGQAQPQAGYQPAQQPVQQQQAPAQQPQQYPPQQQVVQQAPQQPQYAPQVQYPQQAGVPQQQPALQMQQPAQNMGQAPGQMMQQPQQPMQPAPQMPMQYGQPAQGPAAPQYAPPRADQHGPPPPGGYREGPPRYDDRPPEGARGPPHEEPPLPHDACSTIYVDGLPLGSSKRELAHVFRPFSGFMELRLIHKQDKGGREIMIAFAEFSDPYTATACMRLLQNYPWDLDAETSPVLRLSYARPPKGLTRGPDRGGNDRGPPRGGSYHEGSRRPSSSNYSRDDDPPRDRRSGFSDGPSGGGRGSGSSASQSRNPSSSRAPSSSDRGPSRPGGGGGRGGRF